MKIILVIALLAIGGTSAARPRRVVDGQPISGEMAASFVSIRRDDVHICGGVLISNDIVLTMAHCVVNGDSQRHRKLSVKTVPSIKKGNDHRYKIRRIVCAIHKRQTSIIPSTTLVALFLNKEIPTSEDVKPIHVSLQSLENLQLSNNRNPLVAELVAFNSEKMAIPEYAIEHVPVEIDWSIKYASTPDHYAEVLVPAVFGKALKGRVSEDDIGSPLIYNKVLIGLLRESRSSRMNSAIYLDVYEYLTFITKVQFKETSSYIIL